MRNAHDVQGWKLTPAMTQFELDLIARIGNEAILFNMSNFSVLQLEPMSRFCNLSCGTPSSMAGHICAMDPGEYAHQRTLTDDNAIIAARIYTLHTGKPCRLDFFGENHEGYDSGHDVNYDLHLITREDTVAHIRDANVNWPQLSPGRSYCTCGTPKSSQARPPACTSRTSPKP